MGARVVFLARDLPWGASKLRESGCEALLMPAEADASAARSELRHALEAVSPDVCVMDVLETGDAETRVVRETARARGRRTALVCLDDVGAGRLNANAVVNVLEVEPSPHLLVERGIALYEGPAYVALTEDYATPGIANREVPPKVRRVVVTLGGADPAGLAPKATRALRRAFEGPAAQAAFGPERSEGSRATVLIGAASDQSEEVALAVRGDEASFALTESVPSLLPVLREADLGIVAGGLTMHEALAVGLPCIALCQPVRHQAELAQRFADAGAMVNLGPGAAVTEAQIADAIVSLAADPDLRRRFAERGPQLVDGKGAERTAEVICQLASGV